ncbi:uncharacterized protein LOC109852561 [Pseudomyrmex gracilis]|uniref:uncharacterized protein LOC109852561 n=1 Tax=Pseudomyrmex gracilis TaxID=219809 RepID=UPI000995A023|nr:uncharacterized protein LOC109852561 [Pseudomyrmex gracilis]
MENRPAPLRSRRVCRFCLTESEPLSYIYEREHNKPFQVPLALQIMSCVAIEVYAADGMPQMICNMCRWNIDRSYKFKLQCKKADEALRDYPLSGVLPRPFPPISVDPPSDVGGKRIAESRPSPSDSKKPRFENDNSDTKESREREKQEDAREKSDEFYEEEQYGNSEGENEERDERNKEETKLEPGEIRVHACDQCERTFPLRQALMLHVARAHRERNFKCTDCERTFFTKYDLSKHMITHSEEKPFSCQICQKQFSRQNFLIRHEKVHREETRYACQHCSREFFTTEELEKHEEAMHKKEKPFQCNICNKTFQYKQGLERHEMIHSDDKTFVCDYCKEAFHTSTKLARHLNTHAGRRPYLCKLCPRTFLLSHHLTRHMRSHSVEKNHVCEDCGKAFKRKESLEVHQLTHTKRSGMALTCDVCQESCRNRADYVTHIKQHIEAGEKMGPDHIQPENKNTTIELDSDEDDEEEEEDQYSDDDYRPPSYLSKKLPKPPVKPPSESDEDDDEKKEDREEKSERQEKEDRKEQVVYLRGKDGLMKKTIKTLMPIQRREVQDQMSTKQISPARSFSQKSSQMKEDETEMQVQKIVASVFKEHKIPLKQQPNAGQDQQKDSSTLATKSQSASQETRKDDKSEISGATPTAKTVKVIKRIVLRKPSGTPGTGGGNSVEGTPVATKDADGLVTSTPVSHGKIKRVIVRRIIRQGDKTREVVMNADGTVIDPAELAKLPTGNVVKRVVVKRPLDKSQSLVQAVLQSTDQQQAADDAILSEKFELKTSTSTSSAITGAPKTSQAATPKTQTITQSQDQETKEKLEQLEKRVEQQRLKIEELQARKAQQDYETIDEMPDRHDESEDEQQLPLKRVFVKRKQSIYDEEREYNDDETTSSKRQKTSDEVETVVKEEERPEEAVEKVLKEVPATTKTTTTTTTTATIATIAATATTTSGESTATTTNSSTTVSKKGPTISSNKVYSNKRYMIVKPGETSEVEEMSRELCSILETTDSVVKMQETVLSNLTQISGIASTPEVVSETSAKTSTDQPMEVEEPIPQEDCVLQMEDCDVEIKTKTEVEDTTDTEIKLEEETTQVIAVQESQEQTLTLDTQDLAEATAIFEPSDDVLEVQKSSENLNNASVIELSQGNDTINLNDTQDSQDSLEDKLSQMEG